MQQMPPAPPAGGPPAGGPPGGGGSDYQAMHDQWKNMPPPDPMTLLKLIMTPGFLTKHQMDAIKALLANPGAAGGGPTAAPPAAMPGPAAPPSPMGQPPR